MPVVHRFESWKRDIYPKYWIRKSRVYGLDYYCKGLIALIEDSQPKSAFELGIGTGYPFAENLLAAGIDVSGCDISQELIAELKQAFPAVNAYVGGYEDLDKFKIELDKSFDVVYSLRSSWYFTNISVAIDFMLYFARPGGVVIFDIMNKDSNWNKEMVKRKNRLFPLTVVKNIIKIAANWFDPGRYLIDTLFGVKDIMYSPVEIEAILNDRGYAYETHTLAQIDVRGGGVRGLFPSDQKLVYVVHKH